jgi:hypothetical protein
MKRLIAIAVAVAATALVLAPPALAGWVFMDPDGSEALVSNGRMKTETPQGIMIVNAEGKTLTMIDSKRKVYATSNVDDLCDMMKASIDEMMGNVPPEQKAMMEKRMAESKANVKIVDMGDGGEVSGFATHHYEVHINGKPHEELWISDNKKLVDECSPAMMVLASFGQCMAAINPMVAGSNPMSSDEYVALYESGMTVKSQSLDKSRAGAGLEINAVEERDIPESTFEIPEGYKEVSFEQMFGMPAGG